MEQNNLFENLSALGNDKLIRGNTPEDNEKNCLEICRDYIGGVWLQAKTTEDIIVTRISGGLTNQLYKVQLSDLIVSGHVENDDEPHAVAIKLYMPKHYVFVENKTYDAFERLPDTIVLAMASQLGISPRIYGIFPEGFIQRYYDHEQFRPKQQARPELVKKVAHALAKIHSMKVPIKKEKNPLLKSCQQKIIEAYADFDIDDIAKKNNLTLFLEHNLQTELENLAKILEKIDSPTALCHNDFRGSNILITKDETVLVVDMEFISYGPRGSDMAKILSEWGKEMLDFSTDCLPEDAIIEMVSVFI